MSLDITHKISISIPDIPGRHFSFSLKQNHQNDRCEFTQPKKMLAISGIEGNFLSLIQLLIANKVVDKYFRWTYNEGHLIILGDFLKKGEQMVDCLWLIYSLEEKAQKKGGHVHFILGNQEIESIDGDWTYQHPHYAVASTITNTALYSGNNELSRWLKSKNIIEKIGDTLFVHAGISPIIFEHQLSLSQINRLAKSYYTISKETNSKPLLHQLFGTNLAPFWYNGYYEGTANEEEIDAALNQFSATKIITGHIISDQISIQFNGKLININTGNNTGEPFALLMRRNIFFAVSRKRKKRLIPE